jgi:hypothetical protein
LTERRRQRMAVAAKDTDERAAGDPTTSGLPGGSSHAR